MRQNAVHAAPPAGSCTTLHIIRVALSPEIPNAQSLYADLVDEGEIHPDARAMVITGSGYRGALSPPQGPTAVHDVKVHVVRA